MKNFKENISKTNIRFGGNHNGKKIMKPGDISKKIKEESKFGIFNNKRIFNDGKYDIFSLGHNLVKIIKGNTVSYVQEPDKIEPFNIFGYEHEEELIHPSLKYNHGYIMKYYFINKHLFNNILNIFI